MYSCEDVVSYVEDEDVKFIRLSFCDIEGKQKSITIMPYELEKSFNGGISFDSSAITGFGSVTQSDLFLFPDPSTLAVVPWHSLHGKMVRMFCSVRYSDGRPFERDIRTLLKNEVEKLKEEGFTFNFGTEFEFYLFKTDENGERTQIPYDTAGYMDLDPGDKCEAVRREICYTLMDMGIRPESSHHEEGPGQNEIDFRYSDPLTAADNAVTFMSVVRTVAIRNGLYACFGPKPIQGKSGNGFHINMSVNGPYDKKYNHSFMAGVLDHIYETTVFFNPTLQSYERLGRLKAPKYISWSHENRSQLIRIPAAKGEYKRIELRSPDAGANPYLANLLLIKAGMDGIHRDLIPDAPVDLDLYNANECCISNLRTLPSTLADARNAARSSEWLRSVLADPDAFLAH